MPEGNEIHRFADRHAAAFAGRRVSVDSPNGAFPDAHLLNGRTLRSVEAYGKHLGYIFGPDLILHIHLGRYGDFREGPLPLPPAKGALRLRIWTRQKWIELRGAIDCSVFNREQWHALLQRIGPDPLRLDADPAPAFALMQRRNTPMGQLLMDQSVIGGIGNVYRAELLFRHGIHPHCPGREVPRPVLESIWRDARTLMRKGRVDRRMVTTLPHDRPHPRGKARDDEVHYVYRRHGKPCFRCGTKIQKQDMAGRTVYWCPACQKR